MPIIVGHLLRDDGDFSDSDSDDGGPSSADYVAPSTSRTIFPDYLGMGPKLLSRQRGPSARDAAPARFHGAFTGGFSAGYRNSCGSKEGWQPSQFKSSQKRGDREDSSEGAVQQQRPEDFMDEEDMLDHGALQLVANTSFQRRGFGTEEEISGPQLSERGPQLATQANNIGIRLCKSLGWLKCEGKPAMAEEGDVELRPEEIASLKSEVSEPKLDFHGIGYQERSAYVPLPDRRLMDASRDAKSSRQPTGRVEFGTLSGASRSGGEFGLSTLEKLVGMDEDEDVNVYVDPALDMSQYDIALNAEDEERRKHERRQEKRVAQEEERRALEEEEEFVKEQERRALSMDSLGMEFVPPESDVDLNRLVNDFGDLVTIFDIPSSFREDHDIVTDYQRLGAQEAVSSVLTKSAGESTAPRRPMAIEERAKLLGEEAAVERRRQTHKVIKDNLAKFQLALRQQMEPNAFRPFAGDPAKQERYMKFLRSASLGQSPDLGTGDSVGSTNADAVQEHVDFIRTALMFSRPLSSGLAGRFTSGKRQDIVDPTKQRSTPDASGETVGGSADEPLEPMGGVEQRRKAAKMGMFGMMTRTTKVWLPSKLLCKRFECPAPEIEEARSSLSKTATVPSRPSTRPAANVNLVSDPMLRRDVIDTSAADPKDKGAEALPQHPMTAAAAKSAATESTAAASGTEEPDIPDEFETQSRPAMDLFKAVFDASSSESESEQEEPLPQRSEEAPSLLESMAGSKAPETLEGGAERVDEEMDTHEAIPMMFPLPPPPGSAANAEGERSRKSRDHRDSKRKKKSKRRYRSDSPASTDSEADLRRKDEKKLKKLMKEYKKLKKDDRKDSDRRKRKEKRREKEGREKEARNRHKEVPDSAAATRNRSSAADYM